MDRGRKQAVVEGNYMASYRPYGWNVVDDNMQISRCLCAEAQNDDKQE